MNQSWLQVAGLVLDFLGFALIAWEWFLAQRHESAVRAIEEAEERRAESVRQLQRAPPNQNPAMQRHFEMTGDVNRRSTKMRIGETRASYAGVRVRAVMLGMALVAIGFICQMLAAIPGCCRAIGIIPGG